MSHLSLSLHNSNLGDNMCVFLRTKIVDTEGDKKMRFFVSLWNLKVRYLRYDTSSDGVWSVCSMPVSLFQANKETIRRKEAEKKKRARRASRMSSLSNSGSEDSCLIYR